MSTGKKLWTCPKCAHKFIVENIWHSCGNFTIDQHFDGKAPEVFDLFLLFKDMVEQCGVLTWYPQKTRIVFQVKSRFATCQPRKKYLLIELLLTKVYPDFENITKVASYSENRHAHLFRIEEADDLDQNFIELIQESYRIGARV